MGGWGPSKLTSPLSYPPKLNGPFPNAGDVCAVDPLPLAPIVEVGRQLLLDGLVQLLVVLGDHRLLTHLVQHSSPSLQVVTLIRPAWENTVQVGETSVRQKNKARMS